MSKIVISLNTSWNIYNFRLNLARSLKDDGYEVILVAPYDEYTHLLEKEFQCYDIYMNNRGTNPKEDLKTLFDFYKLYKKIKPDIVLNYTIKPNIYGNIACGLLGIKTINNISGLGTVFIKETVVTKIVKFLYKYALSKSSKVFFQNNDDRLLFIENNLLDEKISDLVPGSGVDTQKFTPMKLDKEDKAGLKFLLIARMLWDKGVGEYIEAVKILKERHKNVEFQLLGAVDVANKTAISKEQVELWGEENLITYLGVTDNVQKYIHEADCIVLPSYREGTPRTLLESASMEKPIITTDVPGCREVVYDGVNGFLCEVKSSDDLASKMEKMITLKEHEREEMGRNGRKKMIKKFDEFIVIDKYLKTVQELVD